MKNLFKKKLSAAILAGCSIIAIGSVSLAATPTETADTIPAYHQMNADFNKAAIPVMQDSKAVYAKYQQQFITDYKWMTDNSSKRAAMAFVAIDKAYVNQKITTEQAQSLKQSVLAFYKDNQKYYKKLAQLNDKEAKTYVENNSQKLFLSQNFVALAKKSNLSEAEIAQIFKPSHKNINADEIQQRLTAFMNQLVKQQKMTSAEANSILKYMADSHAQIMQMNDAERTAYIKEIRNLTPEQRMEKMAQATGISMDRLQQIFTVVKAELTAQMAANTTAQQNQAK